MFTGPGMPKTVTCEAPPDGNVNMPNYKIGPASSDDEIDSDKDDNQLFDMPTALPRTNAKYKSNRNRRSSFCRSGNRNVFFEVPKSPLDADFHVGCNDDLLSFQASPSQTSLASDQKEQGRQTKEWMRQAAHDAKSKMAVLCTPTSQLKRSPLTISVQWNGKGGSDFEKCIDKVTGCVAQQPHMGHLLLESIETGHDKTGLFGFL